jgi:hypothetical protein
MSTQLTKWTRITEEAIEIKGKCDLCGKEIFLERISNSYTARDGEKVYVMDVTNKDGRCMLCKMKVHDTKRVMSRIARIGE